MRSYIDENDKKNEIRLLFRHSLYKDKVIIIVEGQSDIRLFRGLLGSENVKLETIDGKRNLVNAMKELTEEFPLRIHAIADSDHDRLTGASAELENYSIYLTDEHDAEVMMLSSPSLGNFISEYSSIENVDTISKNLLSKTFSAAYSIGLIRWINTEEELNLKFRGLNFGQFIDVSKTEIQLDVEVLIQELLKRSTKKSEKATHEFINSKLEEFEAREACKLQVCSGHDLTNIIAMVYRQRWASLDINMDVKKVEASLRLGYQPSFFKDTKLFLDLKSALANSGLVPEMC